MKNTAFIISLIMFPLMGCVDRWSASGEGGQRFEDVAPLCRDRAEASARHQLPYFYDFDVGAAGFPRDTRSDIAARETALCLKQHGFTLTRDWR